MAEINKREKIFHITPSGEFLFWLVIILIVVSLASMGIVFKEKHSENDYQIFLQDVDGLIVGSPVRIMGIEIGHVTKIKPIKDEVYVKFVITNPDVNLPQGTSVTVEFSGLAGSKSLELYPPGERTYMDKSTPILSVMPPKRLHDAMGLLNEMFKKLGTILYTTSDFGSKLQTEGLAPSRIMNSEVNLIDFLKYSDEFLDVSNKKAKDIRTSLEELKKNVK